MGRFGQWAARRQQKQMSREAWVGEVAAHDNITREEAHKLYDRIIRVAGRWGSQLQPATAAGLLLTGARRTGTTVGERVRNIEEALEA